MCYSRGMAQKGDRRRGKPLNPDLGYAGDPVHHATSNLPAQRIGIRELRQHASVYVDLVERGYTVDITNRGRLVAQMIPVRDPVICIWPRCSCFAMRGFATLSP